MELLEQVHGDESQKSVLGSADGIALVASGDGFVLMLVRPIAGKHYSPLPIDSMWRTTGVRGAFVGQAFRGRVPGSPRVSH